MNSLTTKHEKKWVALNENKEVLAIASNIKELDKKVKKSKIKEVIYHYVLPLNQSFSPNVKN